jgi:hypothetical protein
MLKAGMSVSMAMSNFIHFSVSQVSLIASACTLTSAAVCLMLS